MTFNGEGLTMQGWEDRCRLCNTDLCGEDTRTCYCCYWDINQPGILSLKVPKERACE
jgi:hypothetical protein